MFKLKNLFLLLIFIGSVYMFLCYEDWMNDDFVGTSISSKGRGYRALLYSIAQTKYGYWIVRCFPLGVGILFLRDYVEKVRNKKEE